MGGGYKLKLNPVSKILKDHGVDKSGRVIKFTRDTVERLSNSYIPFQGGDLRRLKTHPSNHEVKYTSLYAKYHYHGKLMLAKNGSSWAKHGEKKVSTSKNLKYHTAGTGPKWDRLMLQRRKNEFLKDIQNYIKRGK